MAPRMSVDKPALDLDTFIAKSLSSTPAELHPFYNSFQTLYTRKLWHQLTLKLFEFVGHPLSGPYRVQVFESFVMDFESRINQLRLAEIGVKVARGIDDPHKQLLFLKSLHERVNTEASPDSDARVTLLSTVAQKESHILLLSTIAHVKLLFGDLEGAKTDMDAAWKVLDDMEGVDSGVNGAYYAVAADYYKAKAEYAPYYRNSLLYLACIDIQKDLTSQDRTSRAHDLALSAFLAETIYNFGELLMHPILDALDQTQHEWLKKLLLTFNEGSIGKFEALQPLFPQEPILQANFSFLREKICLMALIDSVFKRTANNRTMDFRTIAQETRLAYGEVEHLLMKAMSLKLIRGSLDEVDAKAHITWVQPRVLSREQIGGLADRLEEWVTKLDGVEQRIAPQVAANA